MEKIKLNKNFGKAVTSHGYELDPSKEYLIDINEEIKQQMDIAVAINTMGLSALDDYYKWLVENGFDENMPNSTNECVSKYYGKKSLWSNDL